MSLSDVNIDASCRLEEVYAMPQNDEDLIEGGDDVSSEEMTATTEGWQREVRCPITGHWVVASRPGERKITSEEIYALLREGDEFP
jgi:hypothetical protein